MTGPGHLSAHLHFCLVLFPEIFCVCVCVCVCEYRKSSLENSFVCSVLHICSALPLRILNELTYIAYFN